MRLVTDRRDRKRSEGLAREMRWGDSFRTFIKTVEHKTDAFVVFWGPL